jgi:hypothetical protein
MIKDRTALVNQLHETLSTLFPEFAAVFSQMDSPTALALLIVYPGPDRICLAGEARVTEVLTNVSRGRMGKVVAKALLEAAQNSVGVLQRQPALATKVSILGERITALTAAIDRVEKEIAQLFHKLCPISLKTFP